MKTHGPSLNTKSLSAQPRQYAKEAHYVWEATRTGASRDGFRSRGADTAPLSSLNYRFLRGSCQCEEHGTILKFPAKKRNH